MTEWIGECAPGCVVLWFGLAVVDQWLMAER